MVRNTEMHLSRRDAEAGGRCAALRERRMKTMPMRSEAALLKKTQTDEEPGGVDEEPSDAGRS